MSEVPTTAEIEALREIDTPTICNLLEMVVPERRGYGYTVEHLHCLYPDMKPIVGFAKTATMRAKNPARWSPAEYMEIRAGYFDYLAEGAAPKISVVQDIDERPGYGAFWGEVFSAVHKALGLPRRGDQRQRPRHRHAGAGVPGARRPDRALPRLRPRRALGAARSTCTAWWSRTAT